MKRMISIIVCTICFILLLTGCNHAETQVSSLVFSFDSKGYYKGFNNLPSNYTIEMAEKGGYYVKQNSKVISNDSVWDKFIAVSYKGRNTAIRMVYFYTEDDKGPFFSDIFYQDGYYYLFDSSAVTLEKQPYKYLLTLEGQFGNPLRDSGVVILTDDNTLTFDKIMHAMLSSSIPNVSPFKLVMFT